MKLKNQCVLIGLIFVILSVSTIIAAQTIPTPQPTSDHPDGPSVTESAEQAQKRLDSMATAHTEMMSYSVFDYPTAYLITLDAAVNDLNFSQDAIVDLTGAQVFYTWEDFAAANATQPFVIVLLHESMFNQVDRAWAYQAYRDEVIFMGFNVTLHEFGDLFSAPCLQQTDPLPDKWEWIITPGFYLRVKDEIYREEIYQAILVDCDKKLRINGNRVGGLNTSTLPLIEPDFVGTIPFMLVSEIVVYGK